MGKEKWAKNLPDAIMSCFWVIEKLKNFKSRAGLLKLIVMLKYFIQFTTLNRAALQRRNGESRAAQTDCHVAIFHLIHTVKFISQFSWKSRWQKFKQHCTDITMSFLLMVSVHRVKFSLLRFPQVFSLVISQPQPVLVLVLVLSLYLPYRSIIFFQNENKSLHDHSTWQLWLKTMLEVGDNLKVSKFARSSEAFD